MDINQFKFALGQIVVLDPTQGKGDLYKMTKGRVTGICLGEDGSKNYFVSSFDGGSVVRHFVSEGEIYDGH